MATAWPPHTQMSSPQVVTVICDRHERGSVPGWWEISSAAAILGPDRQAMLTTAALLAIAAPPKPQHQEVVLNVLSLADGFHLDGSLPPTSVLMAHAFAENSVSSSGLGKIGKICITGGDRSNAFRPATLGNSEFWQSPGIPENIDMCHLRLDNSVDFRMQLFGNCETSRQLPTEKLFDAIFMRQGLCFCDEPHKSAVPPDSLVINGHYENQIACGSVCLDGEYEFDGSPDEENLHTWGLRLPVYTMRSNKHLQIRWCHDDFAWRIYDFSSSAGKCVARQEGEAQNPADVWGCWELWDGVRFTKATSMCCVKSRAAGGWHVPVSERVSCGGIRATSVAMGNFVHCAAAMLDPENPMAFGFFQGSDIMGAHPDVQSVLAEIQQGVESFNHRSVSNLRAVMLMRRGAPSRWQFDGLWVSGPAAWCALADSCNPRAHQISRVIDHWEIVD